MIPQFPDFKPIELNDKDAIESFTKKFAPYSDFNFASMWSWDVKEEMRVSQLNGNLVVRFTDYLTGEPFYSFLGTNMVTETADALLALAEKEGINVHLKLVPEDSIKDIDMTKFKVEEDRDHFDYILDCEKLTSYPGHDLRGHASFYRRFVEEHGEKLEMKVLDIENEDHQKGIELLNAIWVNNKKDEGKDQYTDLSIEDLAIKKFLNINKEFKHLLLVGLFNGDNMIAFSINEVGEGDFATCHFLKANNTYKGIYSYLFSECGKILATYSKKYVNIEQDLGLKNLRQSKKSYQPAHFLKKYIIQRA